MQPTRRSYFKLFKAQVIQECAQPGASIASIALNHGLNANLIHKWIRLQTQKSTALQPAFIPLSVSLAGAEYHPSSSNICVEIADTPREVQPYMSAEASDHWAKCPLLGCGLHQHPATYSTAINVALSFLLQALTRLDAVEIGIYIDLQTVSQGDKQVVP